MSRFKKCFKCETVKPLSEFYKHNAMADGHLNKCKECAKSDALEHRKGNIEKIREYDRKRGKLSYRIKLGTEITRIWRAEDKRRAVAHSAVARSIRNGELKRAPCIRCGEEKTQAHHDDYDKPLEVMWLCSPCHKKRHKELKEEF